MRWFILRRVFKIRSMSKAKIKFLKRLDKKLLCPLCQSVFKQPWQTSCGHQFCFECLQALLRYEYFFLDEQIANGVEFPSLNFPVYCFTDLKFVSLFSYIYIVPLSASLNSETRYTIMISKESDNFGKSSINVSNDSTAT